MSPNNTMKPQDMGRSHVIQTDHLHQTYHVHNGRTRVKIRPVVEMVGLKFGEFAKTRTPRAMGKKKGVAKKR